MMRKRERETDHTKNDRLTVSPPLTANEPPREQERLEKLND